MLWSIRVDATTPTFAALGAEGAVFLSVDETLRVVRRG